MPLALSIAVVLLGAGITALAASLYAASSAPPTAPPASLPACSAGDHVALQSGYNQWADTLLDPSLRLPDGYEPPDLRRVTVTGRQVTLRAFVVPALRDLLHAAAAADVTITVTSSYRSYAEQAELERRLGRVDDLVARAGHSEHQLGTAVDLDGGWDWLRANAPRFGFALSYPAPRSPAMTCYRAEPWHWRYFGVERAQAIADSGLSPREWLWALSLSGGDH